MPRWMHSGGAFLLAMTVSAHAHEMSLALLIAELRQQGYRIIYSDLLVHGEQTVSVEEPIGLEDLHPALAQLGLDYENSAGALVIVEGDPAAPLPSRVHPARVELPLETVIVTGSRHQFPSAGSVSSAYGFDGDDLAGVPVMASDALRAGLRLPGISSVGVSAKPYVRGGLHDELLVMQDGVELLEPFHLADYHSAYSSIDYNTIDSLDFYTGGFPSRYGNRMSGVMDIRNEWQRDDYDTDIGLSTFSRFLHTRGRFGEQRTGSWLLSYRQGDLGGLTDYIQSRSGEPRYKDFSGRVNLPLSESLSTAFGLAWAADDIIFEDEEESSTAQVDTLYGWGAMEWLANPRLNSRLTFSWLRLERRKRQASFEVDEEDPGKGGFLDHRQQVTQLALRNDWSALWRGARWEFGWQAANNAASYRHLAFIDRGEMAEILGSEAEVERNIRVAPEGWSGGGYLQVEWQPLARLTVQPSLRWDAQDYYLQGGAEHQLSPRIGFAWEFSGELRGRLSLGRFHQPEGVQELQVLDGLTRFFPAQSADQAVAALEWRGTNAELTIELYNKRYRKQKGRFENIFNPFVLLPEMEPDRVELAPSEAFARGLDIDSRVRFNEQLEGTLRYSYMSAKDRLDGRWVDRRWSQRHTVNAGLSWRRGSFSAALAVTWHSGWHTSRMPAFVAEGMVIPVSSVLNNTRLDDYLSLDLNLRKYWDFTRWRLEVYLDLANLSDHLNRAGVDFDAEEVEGGYQLVPDQETLLGRVPSVGITLSF